MGAQQGWFSCASLLDVDHGRAIAQAFKNYEHRWWAQRIIINREAKCKILRDLYRIPVTGETIYRGLDGLGRAMSELISILRPEDYEYTLEKGLLVVERGPNSTGPACVIPTAASDPPPSGANTTESLTTG